MSIAPDPKFGEWFTFRHGKFLITEAYLKGARDAQSDKFRNPYKPGEELAQYNYGFANERRGEHDPYDLPFERVIT